MVENQNQTKAELKEYLDRSLMNQMKMKVKLTYQI